MSDTGTDPAAPDAGLEMAAHLVELFEGFRAEPYKDAVGIWTVGFGTTRIGDAPVTASTPPMTIEQAHDAMLAELAPIYCAITTALVVETTPAQRAAICSLAYNVGLSAVLRSTLLRLVNAGDMAAAGPAFGAWVYARGCVLPGLVRRRGIERQVFDGDIAVSEVA